jgi:hypothetical protein
LASPLSLPLVLQALWRMAYGAATIRLCAHIATRSVLHIYSFISLIPLSFHVKTHAERCASAHAAHALPRHKFNIITNARICPLVEYHMSHTPSFAPPASIPPCSFTMGLLVDLDSLTRLRRTAQRRNQGQLIFQ